MPRRIVRASALALLVLASACNDSTGGRPAAVELRIAEAEPVIEVGGRRELKVTALDNVGRPISGAPLRFATSRPEVLGVDPLTGMMVGRAPGQAEVTVESAPARVTVTVFVHPTGGIAVASLALAPAERPLSMNAWPGADTIPLTLRNAAGLDLCRLVPVQVEVADTAVVRAVLPPPAGGSCAVAVQARAPGSTVLRVRAGGRVDSLAVEITPTRYRATLTPPARKEVATVQRWFAIIRTDEGVPVPGVPVTLWYQMEYRTLFNQPVSTDTDSVTVHTDADGRAYLERRLPGTTLASFANGALYDPRGWVFATGRLPDGAPLEASEQGPVVSGPAARMEMRVRDCGYSNPSVCYSFVPATDPVVVRTRVCPAFTQTQELVAVAFDAAGRAHDVAPEMAAGAGALGPVRIATLGDSYTGGTASGNQWSTHVGSRARYASLAPGVDSARITLTHPALPPRTVRVAKRTDPC